MLLKALVSISLTVAALLVLAVILSDSGWPDLPSGSPEEGPTDPKFSRAQSLGFSAAVLALTFSAVWCLLYLLFWIID